MVIQHNMQAMNANRMLGVTTGAQAKSTEKLSSGYRINRAADDAAGLTISEKMRRQIRGLTQASTNAEDGISCVQTAEGAMTEIHSMLQRMNELAVQASNGTMAEKDRTAVQQEVDALITEIDRVAETTKFNEIYLLKGDEASKKTVTTGKPSVSLIDPNQQEQKLAVVAGKSAYAAGSDTAVKGATAATAAAAATMTFVDAAATGQPKDGTPLWASTDGATWTKVDGTNCNTYFKVNDDGSVSFQTGVQAKEAATQTASGTSVADASTLKDVWFTTTAKVDATTATESELDKYLEVDKDGNIKYKDGQVLYQSPADTTAAYGDQIKTDAIAEANLGTYFKLGGTPLKDAANGNAIAVEDFKLGGKYFSEEGVYLGGIFADDGGAYKEVGADQIDKFFNIKTAKTDTVNAALEFNLHVGSEAALNNKISVKIESMSATGIGVKSLAETGLMTEDDATNAIDTITEAINKVSTQRSALGAIQNRLEHTIANLDNVVENTTSAESRIRDVDMAEEMVEYSKNNILAQAGQSMLAQANQSTQGVLSLLG